MRKWKGPFMAGVLAVVLCTGCGTRTLGQMADDHKAAAMQEEGVWEKRYEKVDLLGPNKTYIVSVNVYKDMSEQDMLDVLDYYKLCMHSETDDDTGAYLGEQQDSTFTCYAVFYREDTDEELKRFKCVDGESVEITKEDEAQFAGPEERN